jgi:hypothetical protein
MKTSACRPRIREQPVSSNLNAGIPTKAEKFIPEGSRTAIRDESE